MSQNPNIQKQPDTKAFFLNDEKSLRSAGVTSSKYGDADISSKRRKELGGSNSPILHLLPQQNNQGNMEYENFSSETCVNSTFLECLQDNLDFKGGLLYDSKQNSTQNSAYSNEKTLLETPISLKTPLSSPTSKTFKSAKNDLIITNKPSPTSKGFENTFKLLQNHVTCKHQQRNLEIDLTNKEQPTRLELELEAQQRLNTILERNVGEYHVGNVSLKKTCDNLSCQFVCKKPLAGFLRDFTGKNTTKCDDSSSKQIAFDDDDDDSKAVLNESEPVGLNLIYHATRSPDGTKHLRVVRNLPVSKSKVLCGNRVSQMTRAYDDIEAVTRLLEEKEKDLELTVQIGKELLTQNNTLENRINELETDLKTSNDDRAQLVHELSKKNELIAVLTNDADDGSEAETPTFSKSVTFDLLQRKVNSLQDENKSLKMEASQLAKQTDDVEEHERRLMEDLTSQLNATHDQYDGLNLELERHREENRLQHEQIVSLTARLSEAEMRLHQLTHDNDEHVTLLNITKENQNSLALELVEFKQRYQEVLALLQETQEQLRKQRKRAMPQARSGSFMSSMGGVGGVGVGGGCGGMSGSGYGGGFLQPESLQSELMESSMLSENSMDSGISSDRERANDRIGRLMSQLGGNNSGGINGGGVAAATGSALGGASLIGGVGIAGGGAIQPYQRIFETVRCASKNGNYADSSGTSSLSMSQIGAMSMSSSSGPRMSATALPAGSYYRHDSIYDGAMGGGKTLSCESLTSYPEENYPAAPAGVPGAPGAKDLEAALKRLTPAEVLARRAMLSYAPAGTYNYDEQQQQPHHHHQQKYQQTSATLHMGIRTPDSIMSCGSSGISSTAHMSASSMHQWRLPEKLQIVKPMEGSQTLHHWSRLATPTLSGLLEERPGVTIRGKRGLDDLGMQMYTLEDVEEDFNEDLPGKQFDAPGCVYTFTNSMVMHPDDGFVNDLSFLSQSQMSSRMASTSTSRQPSCPPTPRSGLSRKNSCSTFSVNLGLASMLNERGIKAVTPSALNTPAGPNFSPTVTPCNSPEGSPTRSRSPEPLFGLLSSGADLIRRKLIGGDIERPTRNQLKQQKQKLMLSRLERRALNSLRLVEKCESIGLENIIATQPNQGGIANRSSSPLSQLSSLKSLHTSSNSIVDDIHFERDQIRSVLNKGLKQSTGGGNRNLNKHTALANSSAAYDSDNDETLSASGSDSSFLDEHRTPTNKPAASAVATVINDFSSSNNSSSCSNINYNAQSKQTMNSQSTTAQIANATTAPAPATAGAAVPLPSQTDARIKQMQRQKSRRHLKNGMAAQRPDLGTISGSGGGGGRVRNDLGKVDKTTTDQRRSIKSMSTESNNIAPSGSSNNAAREAEAQQSYTQSFVGTVSSLLFGRKGGWL